MLDDSDGSKDVSSNRWIDALMQIVFTCTLVYLVKTFYDIITPNTNNGY